MGGKRILVGSPVYQKAKILKPFLSSLKNLQRQNIYLDYMFVDDNRDKISSQMLANFERENSLVVNILGKEPGIYLCNEESHNWNDSLMLKVANYKNQIIKYALKNRYDYLFFVDSDLILHPNIIQHLKNLKKEIVSEIFWTKWHNNSPPEPNVWLFDEYDLVPKTSGEKLDPAEMTIRKNKFLNQLKIPGTYQVGGLGACTLISRKALVQGVNFSPIKNLTIRGEDRAFCIRAAVQGIDLYVDTHYPAYHIYREKDLPGIATYLKTNEKELAFVRKYKTNGNKLTLSMIVKNEENRYLAQILASLNGHIDEAVIIDDASTDNTIKLCREHLTGIPVHIIKNDCSIFGCENELRKKQWQETIKTKPDWILNLDADEIIEISFWNYVQKLISNKNYDFYCFRLYDM